jgi:hypothetical protein
MSDRQRSPIVKLRHRLAMLEDKTRIQDCVAQARILAGTAVDAAAQKDIADFIARAASKIELLQDAEEVRRPFQMVPSVRMHIGKWFLDTDGCMTRSIYQA